MLLNFRIGEEEIPVEVTPDGQDWSVRLAGVDLPLQARRARDGSWSVETHQGRRRLWVAAAGDERLVFCDGRVHRLRLPDPEHDDASDEAGAGPNLVADLPGKIVRVRVEPGQTVEAGQPLVIIESMKMETELLAAVAGTVGAVHVAAGQVVAKGDALVDIEPEEGS